MNMRYPKALVHRYGAKAGILMYVREHLTGIPQVDMVVKTPEESIDDVLRRADRYPILWPRIFRSSAVAELEGYEGLFPTKVIGDFERTKRNIRNPNYIGHYNSRESFESHVRTTIKDIQKSPKWLKEDDPWERSHTEPINPDNQPSVFVGEPRYARHANLLKNHQANIFTSSYGILAHDDIMALRHAQVTYFGSSRDENGEELHRGDWVNIVSNGKTVRIRKINIPQ